MTDEYRRLSTKYPAYANNARIEKAFDIAKEAHSGQLRQSGEPYFVHPCSVVDILAELGLDEVSIIAGILHDVPEDTKFTIEDVTREFGDEVARIVDGVTKLKQLDFQSREEQQAESLRKMFLSMASDIRVIIIKLADRLHNMRTLEYKSEAKQMEKARETLEIYAPLAHRLGMSTIKWELEDLSLKYLNREAYDDIASKLKDTRDERKKYIDEIIAQLRLQIDQLGIKYEIEGRPKHIYSIYKKLKKSGKTFDELYDLIAVRIIVNTIKDCYAVLGAVHTIWKPLPMRFKDYIAVPKQNMYQSLHTTLLGTDGRPFEVQIRTFEMHRTAEYGIAAHWKYKEGAAGSMTDFDKKLAWLRELLEWQNDLKDSREFVEALKVDIFSDNVFVFTPKGDVKDFVKGSTPLDFAYGIHSAVGNKCVGAKVNGRLVPLNYELKTGDIVDIITSNQNKGPSRDWLNMVKTAQARSKIRQWFKKELKEENIQKGREMLEKEAKRQGYDLFHLMRPEWLKIIYKRFTLGSTDDMYAAVGYGGLTTNQILSRLIHFDRQEKKQEQKQQIKEEKSVAERRPCDVITVKGYKDMVVRLAKCCNPLPGDEIIGYITRGRGVSVHRADCSNLKDADFDDNRRIEVEWSSPESSKYIVELQVTGTERPGFLADLSQMLYALGYAIKSMNARSAKNSMFIVDLRIEVGAMSDVQTAITKIMSIPNVVEAYRLNN